MFNCGYILHTEDYKHTKRERDPLQLNDPSPSRDYKHTERERDPLQLNDPSPSRDYKHTERERETPSS